MNTITILPTLTLILLLLSPPTISIFWSPIPLRGLPLTCNIKQGCLTEENCPCFVPTTTEVGMTTTGTTVTTTPNTESTTTAVATTSAPIVMCQWPRDQRHCHPAIPNCLCVVPLAQ